MKINSSARFYTKTIINIIYSAFFTILVELFAVTNIGYLAPLIAETQSGSGLFSKIITSDDIVLLLFIRNYCIFYNILVITKKNYFIYRLYI